MSEGWTRREFASLLAVSSVIPATGVGAADAPEKTVESEKPAEEVAKPVITDPVDLILSVIQQQYSHAQLDEAALEEVRSDVQQNLARSRTLGSYPLTNANEPGFVFSAWRADRVTG